MNLHSLVSSPDFKDEEVDAILEQHYTLDSKPDFMEMIEKIKQTTPTQDPHSDSNELIVHFSEEEMNTPDRGVHLVNFPEVMFYNKIIDEFLVISPLPIGLVIGMDMHRTLLENVVDGNHTKEAIAIHIIDHLMNFMDDYDF